MSKSRFTTKQLATAGIIAAIYAVLSLFSSVFGIAYGPIQCRFSEALTVLPFSMSGVRQMMVKQIITFFTLLCTFSVNFILKSLW